jgi:hypothetical protein
MAELLDHNLTTSHHKLTPAITITRFYRGRGQVAPIRRGHSQLGRQLRHGMRGKGATRGYEDDAANVALRPRHLGDGNILPCRWCRPAPGPATPLLDPR